MQSQRAGSQIDQDLHVLVIGNKADEVSKSIAQVPNVKKVIQTIMKSMNIIYLKIFHQ